MDREIIESISQCKTQMRTVKPMQRSIRFGQKTRIHSQGTQKSYTLEVIKKQGENFPQWKTEKENRA